MIDKVKTLLRQKYFYLVIMVVASLVFLSFFIIQSEGVFEWTLPVILTVILICILMGSILFWTYKKGWKVENKFVLLFAMIGGLFIICMPPGEASDEIKHFRRAYSISQGYIVPPEQLSEEGNMGNDIPVETDLFMELRVPSRGAYSKIKNELLESDSGVMSKQEYTSAAVYNPISYFPQVVGAWVGGLLNVSVVGVAYLMKIFGFAICAVLLYYAIKITPKFKTILMFIAFSPMAIQEFTSMSPNGITIGICLLLIAYVFHLTYEKKDKIGRKELIYLCIMAILISMFKIVYVALLLLYLVIPKERFGSKKKKVIYLSTMAIVVGTISFVWLLISSKYLVEVMPGVDAAVQTHSLITNPIRYFIVIARTVIVEGFSWVENILGFSLSALCVKMPSFVFLISFGFMVILFAQCDEYLKIKPFDRAVYIVTFLVIFGLICTSLYIQWTEAGKLVIDGVQGRYFLPIMALIPPIICKTKKKGRGSSAIINEKAVFVYGLSINILACVTLFAQNI